MKILANDGLNQAAINMLEKAGFEVIQNKVAQEQLINYINENKVTAILVRSATKVRKDIIDACPELKLIGRGGVGMDNIDVAYAREKGLHVINTPAASSDSVAELAMAHLYGMVRFLPDSNRNMPLEGDSHFADLKKRYAKGQELKGKTLGLIGTGRIAMALAERAIGVGMKVIGHSRSGNDTQATLTLFDGQTLTVTVKNVPIDTLLKESDFVSVHVPKLDKPILDKTAINKMKDGSAIINTSRGGIVDEVALLEALDSGKIRYAALDVFDNEPQPSIIVLMRPELSLSPHIGASTVEAQERIGEELAEQIISLLT
jgi:D-3-phosphoglycerate dehydrogenase / 2-oxoglutarate reductase